MFKNVREMLGFLFNQRRFKTDFFWDNADRTGNCVRNFGPAHL